MAPKKAAVTYAFGRRDRVDPKHAPFGVLAVGKNLRVRKDGRLGVRKGYEPLSMTTPNGTLVAYDLHQYRGRLLALGSDTLDGYPTELFEYIAGSASWRGTDPTGERVMVNPFTRLREVAGLPQPDDGVQAVDSAMGAGFVCVVTTTRGGIDAYAIIVNASTDQTIHAEKLPFALGVGRVRVVFTDGVFYVGGGLAGGVGYVQVFSYQVGISDAFGTFIASLGTVDGIQISGFDMYGVTNPSTARIAIAIGKSSSSDTTAYVFTDAAVQVGSTIHIAGVSVSHIAIEADQTDGKINIFTSETGPVGRLRTYNFSGALLDGPTATTSGNPGFLGRLPALGSLLTDHIAVAVNDANHNTVIQYWDIDAHTLTATVTIGRSYCTSRLVSGQSASQPMAVVFAGIVGGDIGTPFTFRAATNALFFVTPTVAHMTTRDIVSAKVKGTQSLNVSFGALCWTAVRDPGVGIAMPVVTLVDFQSTARRQAVTFGNLLYFSGGTPSVYDGRFCVGLNFNERPAVISATPSNGVGLLAPSARYRYVVVWEYTLSDGSVIVGPASATFDGTTGAGQDTMAVVVTTPHTLSVAAGDALFGANVSAALFRTGWNATASTPESVFHRCNTVPVPIGMANYGADLTITDLASDISLIDEEILYTQDSDHAVSQQLIHEAPLACRYIAATEARLLTGGLTRPSLVQVSKSAQLNEAFEFNNSNVYFSVASGAVIGVQSLDSSKLVFTEDRIFALSGDGPDDIGIGALSAPVEIPAPSGLINPWSFLDAPDGLWFQVDDTKLFRMPRGGGSPTWEGVDIVDTLVEFTLVVGACKHKGDNAALFAYCSDAGSARFLVRDFRTENWFEDTPVLADALLPTGHGVDAITSYIDGLAYATGGNVFRQSANEFADGAAEDFIETMVRTQPLYSFGLGGYGQHYDLLLTGEFRGNCQIDCRVSYDDGTNYTTLAAFGLYESEGLVAGQTIQRRWALPQDITSSLVVEFSTSGVSVTPPPEGILFQNFHLTVVPGDGQSIFIEDGLASDFTLAPPDAFEWLITTEAHTNALFLFGPDGFGSVLDLTLTAIYLGDCTLGIRVSYDEGESFTTLPSVNLFAVDGGLTVGNPFIRVWELPEGVMSSLVVEFTIVGVAATLPTEGFVFNQLDVLVEPEEGLRELDPDEMA